MKVFRVSSPFSFVATVLRGPGYFCWTIDCWLIFWTFRFLVGKEGADTWRDTLYRHGESRQRERR